MGGGDGRARVYINGTRLEPPRAEMTGLELKELGGRGASSLLVRLDGEGAGEVGTALADDARVQIRDGMRFRLVDSATFGAAVMVPPALQRDVDELRRRGHGVDVHGDEYGFGVVVRDYPVPAGIWDRGSVDLMVLAYDAYPNHSMDMFWAFPQLSLRGGGRPRNTGPERRFGRTWQAFSWHGRGWDPARDSLLTYLPFVDRRLGMPE